MKILQRLRLICWVIANCLFCLLLDLQNLLTKCTFSLGEAGGERESYELSVGGGRVAHANNVHDLRYLLFCFDIFCIHTYIYNKYIIKIFMWVFHLCVYDLILDVCMFLMRLSFRFRTIFLQFLQSKVIMHIVPTRECFRQNTIWHNNAT